MSYGKELEIINKIYLIVKSDNNYCISEKISEDNYNELFNDDGKYISYSLKEQLKDTKSYDDALRKVLYIYLIDNELATELDILKAENKRLTAFIRKTNDDDIIEKFIWSDNVVNNDITCTAKVIFDIYDNEFDLKHEKKSTTYAFNIKISLLTGEFINYVSYSNHIYLTHGKYFNLSGILFKDKLLEFKNHDQENPFKLDDIELLKLKQIINKG